MIASTLIAAAAALILLWLYRWSRPKSTAASTIPREQPLIDSKESLYDAIEPLPVSWDWSTTPPIKIRPFKPFYHLSMSLENIDLSSFIEMDDTYLDRMRIRRETMSEHRPETLQCNKVAEPAVLELYEWMVETYLPKRFPSVYKRIATSFGRQLHNLVLDTDLPIRPTSPTAALETLGENVDTDFLILLPSSKAADESAIYHLEAFGTCFPAGFSTREKCGNPLATIHAPVPGYAAKLEKSMDRFFAKIDVGRIVRRTNWSISTDDKLYSAGGNHMYGDEEKSKPFENNKTLDVDHPELNQKIEQQKRDVIVEDCRLRCERQTLHRLPKTKALVFAFKTYLYKLDEVKAEGLGPALAEAIDGLGQGSVPGMAFYKRGVVWGDKVKEYLNS